MTSMTDERLVNTGGGCVGGVDTHGLTHHAAVVDGVGRHLADRQFPATARGYRALVAWMRCQAGARGVTVVGVEGTGAYGAQLTRALTAAGITVVEVDRPDRKTRRLRGKSDPVDAYAAAAAVLSGRARGVPKERDGVVEAIRVLRVARRSAIKARTQVINQMRALLVTAPAVLRERLTGLGRGVLVDKLARSRPGSELSDPVVATRWALRRLARHHQVLDIEVVELDAQLGVLVARAAPAVVRLNGVGTDTAGQLLVTAGGNPDRMRSEAAFAHLVGAAPIPASSGRVHRHRLNRGGDRQANNALYVITLSRMRHDPRTQTYVQRRTHEGLSKREIIRCLKRYIAREIYRALTNPPPPTAIT
jgi:transposase